MKNNKNSGLTGIFLCIIAVIALKVVAPLIGKLLSVVLTIVFAALLLFCVFIAISAVKGAGSETPKAGSKRAPSQAEAKLLSEGRTALARIRTSGLKIADPAVKEKCNTVCSLADKILAALNREPDKVSGCVDLLEYYLPELSGIIAKYISVQDHPGTEEITGKLSLQLDSIIGTMEKKLSSVSSGEQVDISSDLDALKIALSLDDASEPSLPKDEAEELADKYSE